MANVKPKISVPKEKMGKYTVNEMLRFFKKNNILLVNGDDIGEVELPEIDPYFVRDCDLDGDIK